MAYKSKDEMVSKPKHYQLGEGMQVIDVIDAVTKNMEGIEAVDTANAIKYICRWKNKNGLQDIEKAIWYLTDLKERLEKKERAKEIFFNMANCDPKETCCCNCRFRAKSATEEPCASCNNFNNFINKNPDLIDQESVKCCPTCKNVNTLFSEEPCNSCLYIDRTSGSFSGLRYKNYEPNPELNKKSDK